MRNVLIEYTLKSGVDADDIRSEVEAFIGELREHTGADYAAFRKGGGEPRFAHVGRFPDPDKLAAAQAMAFFGEFASFLRDKCAEGPTVTELTVVAATNG